MNILDKIIATKKEEITLSKTRIPAGTLRERCESHKREFRSMSRSIESSRWGIIAEFKRCSPSRGFINEHAEVTEIVPAYEKNGAAAVSILTDRVHFGGCLPDLEKARQVCSVPLLRKDFIIDEYQIYEAVLAGADAILLIASALTPRRVSELSAEARRCGLEVLLEIHSPQQAEYICDTVDMVGVNNRDLTTFVTNINVSQRLAQVIPDKFIKISESGISLSRAVLNLRGCGYQGFLMGENFMKTDDPGSRLGHFIGELCGE